MDNRVLLDLTPRTLAKNC